MRDCFNRYEATFIGLWFAGQARILVMIPVIRGVTV